MSQEIKGDALSSVKTALGLGAGGEQSTELQDGVVDQVIDLIPMVRRGRTQAATDGLYTAQMVNVHGAADSKVASQIPYELIAGGIEPYPSIMPPQFDVWLMGAMVTRISGTGTVEAILAMRFGTNKMGWAINQDGDAVTPTNPEFVLGLWDALINEGTTFALLAGTNGTYLKIGQRLPRGAGSDLKFRTTASAIATYNCNLILGVFPMSLGQDGIV